MTEPTFDWNADVRLPISGKTPRSRHASATGALRAAKDRGKLSCAYLELLRVAGPLTDDAASMALGRGLSSICSVRNGLGDLIVDAGSVRTPWKTRRTTWGLRENLR
jgi:hypothetical protein